MTRAPTVRSDRKTDDRKADGADTADGADGVAPR